MEFPFCSKRNLGLLQCPVAAVKFNTFKDEQVQSNNIYPTPCLCEYNCTVLLPLA